MEPEKNTAPDMPSPDDNRAPEKIAARITRGRKLTIAVIVIVTIDLAIRLLDIQSFDAGTVAVIIIALILWIVVIRFLWKGSGWAKWIVGLELFSSGLNGLLAILSEVVRALRLSGYDQGYVLGVVIGALIGALFAAVPVAAGIVLVASRSVRMFLENQGRSTPRETTGQSP